MLPPMKQTEATERDLSCQTKYPIVLIHGAGFRDLKWPVYWGSIPGALEKRGARVFYGLQDCWASTETNAREIVHRIDKIRQETGAEKVNLIAHSKGGLEARMAASSLGAGDRIASVTTIATPHHGSKTIDRLLAAPKALFSAAAFAVNNWIRVVGDKRPDFLAVCRGFTTGSAAAFNRENPDVPGIFYQSYACVMSRPLSDINLSTANFAVNRLEGPNDGLVTVESASWGENCHVLRANGRRGISHLDAIDLRRAPLSRKGGDGVSDIDIPKLLEFHKKNGHIATITAVNIAQMKGVLQLSPSGLVEDFREKDENDSTLVNGGYMVLEPEIFRYLKDDTTIFEKEPMAQLSEEGQLDAYLHEGFWQCMDTQREKKKLEDLWESGSAPWKTWE